MKVLILEQEKTIRQSLINFIERFNGFEVFTAPTCREGVSLFEEVPFDMVLCGHKLPDGDGLEVLKGWTKTKPKLISILMTAYSDEQLRQEAEQAGIRGYLEKPFDLKQLEEAMGMKSSEFGVSLPAGRQGVRS
ncbi:MAG: response regulator [Deltaproteobacteria bacterium]|nr:response regulator [Deltaproteobacteria bacterium]